MAETKNTIMQLFEDYDLLQFDYSQQRYSREYSGEWNSKRIALYSAGVVTGKYRENDEAAMRFINADYSDQILKQEIRRSVIADKNENTEDLYWDEIKKGKYKLACDELRDLDRLTVNEWIEKYKWYHLVTPALNDNQIRGFIFLYYAYENHMREINSCYSSDMTIVEFLYKSQFEKTSEFRKYGLLPIDTQRELLCLNPPRIYDKSIDKTLILKNVSTVLGKELATLIKNGLVDDLSVRVSNTDIREGWNRNEIIFEAVDRGKVFSLDDLGDCSITRLFSDNYDDCLWATITESNITFEELCDDFDIDGNSIVTQVVHLEYCKQNEEYCITHLDHEYIFYSIDEYEKRKSNPYQKGTEKKRVKSFKIDNARIPFTTHCDIAYMDVDGDSLHHGSMLFLYFVIDCYFKHKDLLHEYFEKVLQ